MRRTIVSLTLVLSLLVATTATARVGIDEGTNALRRQAGLAALQTSATLTELAQARAQEITRSFTHNLWWTNRIGCWRGAGENIAFISAESYSDSWAVNAWWNSATHRANMLGDFTLQGSAIFRWEGPSPVTGNWGVWVFAVQLFQKDCSGSAPPPPPPATPKPQPKPTSPPPAQVLTLPDTAMGR